MNALQKKIYDYFDRNPELKVLFIFQNSVDLFAASDLGTAEWRTGYRFVDFKGDWFTTKYNLDKRVIGTSTLIHNELNTNPPFPAWKDGLRDLWN